MGADRRAVAAALRPNSQPGRDRARVRGPRRDVFEKVTEARAKAIAAGSVAQQGQAENILTQALRSLFAVAEALTVYYRRCRPVLAGPGLLHKSGDCIRRRTAARPART